MLLLIDLHLPPLRLELAFQLQHPETGVGSGFAFFGGCRVRRPGVDVVKAGHGVGVISPTARVPEVETSTSGVFVRLILL